MANNFNFKVEIDFSPNQSDRIMKGIEKAFRTCAAELDGRFDEAISGSHWTWPRDSLRGLPGTTVGQKAKAAKKGGGNTVGTPRNIIDSGDLKGSKSMSMQGFSAEWTWSVEYAAAVHDGARIQPWGNKNAASVELPARPWTNAVLEGNVAGYNGKQYKFADEMQKKVGKFLK